MKTLCKIGENSDVKVIQNDHEDFQIFLVNKKWPNNYELNDTLSTLLLIREAGYKVPEEITQKLAKKIVNELFNDDSL